MYREECGPDNPLRCYVGDVSNRVGVIGNSSTQLLYLVLRSLMFLNIIFLQILVENGKFSPIRISHWKAPKVLWVDRLSFSDQIFHRNDLHAQTLNPTMTLLNT